MSFARRAAWGVRLLVLGCLLALIPAPISYAFTQSVMHGDAALWAHDPASALAAYQAAPARRPGDAAVIERMAHAAQQAGRADIAAAYRGYLAWRDGWTPARLRAEGDALAASGDTGRAAPYWEASLSGAPEDKAVLRQLVDLAMGGQDWDRAARWLDEAQRLDPTDAEAAFQAALLRIPIAPARTLDALNRAAADPELAPGVAAI